MFGLTIGDAILALPILGLICVWLCSRLLLWRQARADLEMDRSLADMFGPNIDQVKVYKRLLSIVLRLAIHPANNATRARWTHGLQDVIDDQATESLVECLADSRRNRKTIESVMSTIRVNPAFQLSKWDEAIRLDEIEIHLHVKELVESRSGRAEILSLADDDASLFFSFLHEVLCNPSSIRLDSKSHSEMCRAGTPVLIKLLRRLNKLPDSLFVKGIELCGPDPVSGGGFADVFLGRYRGELIALKRLRLFQAKTDSESARIAQRFQKEALVWQCVQHPNVLPLLGMDTEVFSAQYMCMVSPWMKNRDIMTYMKEVVLFTRDCDRLLLEIAQGLTFLHEQNIVHGDLRGGNIMIDNNGHALLSDFGLADVTETTLAASTTSQRSGSTRWMAPELHDPERYGTQFRRTKATDIYAYACVSVEIYASHMPFLGHGEVEAILKTLDGVRPNRPTFRDGGREMSDEHWTLVNLCWQELLSQRPSASQVVAAMDILAHASAGTTKIQHSGVTLVDVEESDVSVGSLAQTGQGVEDVSDES